jgi:phosphoserine phosphatase
MKRLFYGLFLLLSVTLYATHTIVEHHQISALLDYLHEHDFDRHTVIIFDIDNTLAAPRDYCIGSDEWVTHEINKLMLRGMDAHTAWHTIKPLYIEIQNNIELALIEQEAIELIDFLQENGFSVIAVTARSLEISDRTLEQLKAIGIDFSRSGIWHEEFTSTGDILYRYKNGTVFCHGNDKGTVLHNVLNHLSFVPRKIIAVDDKEIHLHSIQQILHPDVSFVGIRYARLDTKVAAFNPMRAEIELRKLNIRIK